MNRSIQRFSSRRQPLAKTFLADRLQGALSYDRIAGYFSSSLLEVVGEALESVAGPIRIVCNSDLHPLDVQTAKAAQAAVWQSWTASQPEALLQGAGAPQARERFRRLYALLRSGKLQVRVLPDEIFGLIHGKAGVITLADGRRTCFLGSANESRAAWQMNYELLWEDPSPESVQWVQEEFDALWGSPQALPLAEAVVQDIDRLARRKVLHSVGEWMAAPEADQTPDPAAPVVEAPVYRQEVGLWQHQKYFVKMAFDMHCGPTGKARFVLADQVGLGKTLQLAMAAQLMALAGDRPILVICPKTLLWQWQDEMRDLLDMPSAVWDGRRWVDEQGVEHALLGPEGIRKCPRRVGIVSSGLVSRRSEAAQHLLRLQYDCVILDEAHRARRGNLGNKRDGEAPDPNNLLAFMYQLAERTRSLLLATATPVQLRPIEAWDLLNILSCGDETVLGNAVSRWRHGAEALALVMGRADLPTDEDQRWDWLRNPLPSKQEHRDFAILRKRLQMPDQEAVAAGNALFDSSPPDRARINRNFDNLVTGHNPFIRRIVRRTRQQLEQHIDPETHEPLLKPITVELLGEGEHDAVRLPPFLREAYDLAEEFCAQLSERMQGAGFMRTLLLRRVGSSMQAGMLTAQAMLKDWESIETPEDEDEEEDQLLPLPATSRTLTDRERLLLERFLAALEANKERDPKVAVVVELLRNRHWLELGCIVFSQYRASIQWLAEHLTREFPDEPIALYSGATTSGIMRGGQWTPATRESLKLMVKRGELRLMLGTDAASEGLNLQRLARLINLDLPWNPTRLEQRKGRIPRIGQLHDIVQVYNMRYQDSLEDRVHQLLSDRLHDIYTLFGQIPDVLEDVWVRVAVGQKTEAQKIIDNLPEEHPFEVRYSQVAPVDWESCSQVLDAAEKRRVLRAGWS